MKRHHLTRSIGLALALILTGQLLAQQPPVPQTPAPKASEKAAKKKSRKKKIIIIAAVAGAAAIGLTLAAKRLNNEGVFARF